MVTRLAAAGRPRFFVERRRRDLCAAGFRRLTALFLELLRAGGLRVAAFFLEPRAVDFLVLLFRPPAFLAEVFRPREPELLFRPPLEPPRDVFLAAAIM